MSKCKLIHSSVSWNEETKDNNIKTRERNIFYNLAMIVLCTKVN